jgi:hypothetical protein
MVITHCLCTGQTFASLCDRARRESLNLEAAMAIPGLGAAGRRCGLCRPYLREALRTGQTTFHHIITDPKTP